jgi:hypothetical protein
MRLRTDNFHLAGWKRAALIGGRIDVAKSILDDPIPAAEPGDVWIVRQSPKNIDEMRFGGSDEESADWPIVGYALTCPNGACRFGVHDWTWANNCSQKLPEGGPRCVHMRDRQSCWTWTGSVEEGTLTANPSLHSPTKLGGCGFHGWLKKGVLA